MKDVAETRRVKDAVYMKFDANEEHSELSQ